MDQELKNRLDALQAKIDATYTSAEKTRKYFLIAMIVSLAAVLLPIIGLFFAIPSFLTTYSDLSGLSGL
jgi:hypothetical protein